MKLLRSLIEEDYTSFGPNQYFRVMGDSLKVWEHVQGRPSGRGSMSLASFRSTKLNQYDEIHWLHGGLFAVQQGGATSIHMRNPDDYSEGEYHANRRAGMQGAFSTIRGLKAALHAGSIEEITKDDANIPRSYR